MVASCWLGERRRLRVEVWVGSTAVRRASMTRRAAEVAGVMLGAGPDCGELLARRATAAEGDRRETEIFRLIARKEFPGR